MRPDVLPKKLTRRSASPSGNVFRMMASVSRAGIEPSARRLRFTIYALHITSHTQMRSKIFITRASAAQSSHRIVREILAKNPQKAARLTCEDRHGIPLTTSFVLGNIIGRSNPLASPVFFSLPCQRHLSHNVHSAEG